MSARDGTPSWRSGAHGARLFSRVVVAVWLIGLAALTPAVLGLDLTVIRSLARVASGAASDALMVAAAAARPLRPIAVVVAAMILVLLTGWGVLWRAGAARWLTWRAQPKPALAEVLGLGLGGWWRYARLWATWLLALAAVAALAAVPLLAIVDALDDGSIGASVWLGLAGLVLAGGLALVMTAAWLRACWELARPDRRSAVVAFGRGLAVVLRHPLAGLAPLLVWGGAAWLSALAPLACGWLLPAVRGTLPMALLIVLAGAVRAAARVAMLTSYADPESLPR